MDDTTLLKYLAKNPNLREKIETLLEIAEADWDHIDSADMIEDAIIEEGRTLQQAVMQGWAIQKSLKISQRFEKKHNNCRKDSKKNSVGELASEQ